mgnify:CR=1 FL=1
MSGTLNKVILVGNVGRDPEVRPLPDGSEVASFSLATSESWKDKNTNERIEKTEWHKIVIFNEYLVNLVKNNVKKSMKLYIEGQIQTKKWTDSGGNPRDSIEIVLSKFRGDLIILDQRRSSEYRNDAAQHNDSGDQQDDDSIPF